MTPKPSKSDFKTFWSVFEAKQERKRKQLEEQNPQLRKLKEMEDK
jgi:hypothetical protein